MNSYLCDDVDFRKTAKVINILRKNSRTRFLNMHMNIAVPLKSISDVYSKVKKELIIKNCSIINFENIEGLLRMFLIIYFIDKTATREKNNPLEKTIKNDYEIFSASDNLLISFLNMSFSVNNLYLAHKGLLADCIFSSAKDLENFMKEISQFNIMKMNYFFVLTQELSENFNLKDME